MSWLDISVTEHYPSFAKKLKAAGLRTQIVMKVPACDITVVRIDGDKSAMEHFLHQRFDERVAQMHCAAMKEGAACTLDSPKNRALRESRT